MKQILLFCILQAIIFGCKNSVQKDSTPEVLFAINPQGSLLFKDADAAVALRKIPFGTAISIQESLKDSVEVLQSSGLPLSGRWLRVTFNDAEGFVFSPEFSHIRPLTIKSDRHFLTDFTLLGDTLSIIERTENVSFDDKTFTNEITEVTFARGKLTFHMFDSCPNYAFDIADLNFDEIYFELLMRTSGSATLQNGIDSVTVPVFTRQEQNVWFFADNFGAVDEYKLERTGHKTWRLSWSYCI